MKSLLFGLLLITLLASPRNSQCRIGENLEECKTRYGNPVEIKKDTALFIRNGMTVSVHFIDGRVDEIRYYKVNPKNSKKTSCPSEAEVNILLRANAQDTTWELELAQLGDTLWRNREKGLSAFRTPRALTISIADPAAYKAFHERKTAARDLEAFQHGGKSRLTCIDWVLLLKFDAMPAILDGSPKGFEPHQLSAEELPRQLQVDAAQGLLTEEARRRLVEHGPNELKERSARKPWAILWRFWCKLLKGSVSCDNCRDDGTDLGTRFVQGTAL